MTSEPTFARLVSLACHDLRTPLATVTGFAGTLARLEELKEPADRYVEMIAAASDQMADILDYLALAAGLQSGRYEPLLKEADTLELARTAAERLGPERASVEGEGGAVTVDPERTGRAAAALAECALRHGGLERVRLTASGTEIALEPIAPAAAPIVLGEELRDLGAAVAVRLVERLGGSVALEGERLLVRLPA